MLLVFRGDSGELRGGLGLGDGEDVSGSLVLGGGGSELLGGGVVDLTLLRLVLTSGEENQLGLVLVESLDVNLELLFTRVSSSVVNGDSDRLGKRGAESDGLDLSKGETTTISNLAGVPPGARGDNGTKFLRGPGEGSSGLTGAEVVSSRLLGGLVEVGFGSPLPVLA